MGSDIVEADGSAGGADDDIRITIGRYSLRACNPVLELIYTHDPLVKNINLKEVKLSGLPGSTSSLSAVHGEVEHLREFAEAVLCRATKASEQARQAGSLCRQRRTPRGVRGGVRA
jgi:hypothetical protein